MKTGRIILLTTLALHLFLAAPGLTLGENTAIPEGREVLAVVNGEEIFVDELEAAAAARPGNLDLEASSDRTGFNEALDRLINAKLILQEARDVGLDEQPEIRDRVNSFKEKILVRLLKNQHISDVEPDKEDVDRIFRNLVRHWKFRALSFEDLEQARAFSGELGDEGDFDSVGERYVQEGLAVWDGGEREVKESDVAPEISAAFLGKEVGYVTPVIKAINRLFVFKLTGVRYDEDPDARREASKKALSMKREKVLNLFLDELIDKYATVDQEVLSSIGSSDFPDMEKDERVLAVVDGESPVRVADLSLHLKGKFYHGDRSSKYGEALESDHVDVMRELLEDIVYRIEARRIGIDETDNYLKLVADFEDSLVFGMYLEKFLVPQARVSDKEIRSAYEESEEEFLVPQTVVINTLTFASEEDALRVMESLKRGADFKWLSENARGQARESVTGQELPMDSIPGEIGSRLAGASAGDILLNRQDNDLFTVISVQDVPPRQKKPLEKVRSRIASELFEERMEQVISDLAAELREISEITIYQEKLGKDSVQRDRD